MTGQRAQQLLAGDRGELGEPRVAAVGAGDQLGLVEQPVVAHEARDSRLVALAVVLVDDVLVAASDAAQAHDLTHRIDALRTGLHALGAVGAVEDALRVWGEVVQALEALIVARVADEAVGLASAAGPMKPGSTSIARQSDTHAPHWMHAIVWVTSTIDSSGRCTRALAPAAWPAATA